MRIQDLVDAVVDRKFMDKFTPVTKNEYKQRETRNKINSMQMADEIVKLRFALEKEGIEVETPMADNELITALLTDEDQFQHQMEVNEYNDRVQRYQEGSLLERMRVMIDGAPTKPSMNPAHAGQVMEDQQPFGEGEDIPEDEEVHAPQEEVPKKPSIADSFKASVKKQHLPEDEEKKQEAAIDEAITNIIQKNLKTN